MTAPDPRLNEIQARVDKTPPDHGHTQSWLPAADVRYLLAELRKAHEALERIEIACDAMDAGVAIRAGDHRTKSVAATTIRSIIRDSRAAVAAAKGDEA